MVVMERSVSCREQSEVRELCDGLTEAYTCFLAGSCPGHSAGHVAGVVYSGIRGLLPGTCREGAPPQPCEEHTAELTCISLSLLQRMSSSLTSQDLPPHVKLYYLEVLKVLFEDMHLMPHLVHQFQAEDQIISHLAAKTASACVFYLILQSGTASAVWQEKCVEEFQRSSPGTELDACLWSLTEVSKKLLKGGHQDVAMTVLATFDSSLIALCSRLLPEETKETSQVMVDFTRSRHWGTTVCLLLNLIEVLTASSLVCGAGVCLKSQRITHLHCSALLKISCSSEYYVRKRVLLLLKRAVLQVVGEDWTSGETFSHRLKSGDWSSDMSMLARSVLTAVADNWLQSVQVESAPFFGGTRRIPGDEGQNPDCVILRAVGLIVLKSIELHIQTAARTAEDQIISHLAAKTASACVFYLILQSGTASAVWQEKCVEEFQRSSPGTELDACLWSLTEVSKKLLKGGHQDVAMTVLATFDSSLIALCSRLLPEETKETSQVMVDFTRSRHWGTTVCLLLNLIEVLTASSLVCGAGVCLKSQRITHLHCSALLKISCSSEYYVRKRVLLLLKRAVLQVVGEDWTSGETFSHRLKSGDWSSDMSMLARSVLTAVADNWLQSVQVESAPFFGGTRRIPGDEGQNPDCVILRAVGLIVLKSIELHIQTAARTGVDTAAEVCGYLQRLWGFLRRCSFKLREVTHLCCWISMLFGEQDDDMMEAARALLFIFLHCSSGQDGVLEAACASGINPHCHFVLLLQSVCFDRSILLDFLISAETCFLDYFVRYLKYLRDDWQGFTAACGGIAVSDYVLSRRKSATCGADRSAPNNKAEPDKVESGTCVQPTDVKPPVERFGLAPELRLVEYDSTDESDPEDVEVSEVELVASACEKSAFNVKQCESAAAFLREPRSILERKPALQSEQTPGTSMVPPSGQLNCDASAKAVHCLSELREVVTRLHTKKLFPYNPSSLLKLLAQIEGCYTNSNIPQFNKS